MYFVSVDGGRLDAPVPARPECWGCEISSAEDRKDAGALQRATGLCFGQPGRHIMRKQHWLGALFLLFLLTSPVRAWVGVGWLDRINRKLAGQLVDYTRNHGADRRIWSPTLKEKRELYVYLPPGYNPTCRYPVMLWLHGVYEDEQSLVNEGGLEFFDAAMASGRLTPLIIVIPDGSKRGSPTLFGVNPLWGNSRAGPYRDFLLNDIWGFVQEHYLIRPEREAHILAGFSGGGAAAFRIGIRFREQFGVCIGIHPPLNIRWLDCHCNHFGSFDPNCWGWRTSVSNGREIIGRFYGGLLVIRLRNLVYPLYGKGPDAIQLMSENNAIEMIDQTHLQPGELAMYVVYGGKDQFNIAAQVDSFLYRARERGLAVGVSFDPNGTHSWRTARPLLPDILEWLAPLMAPYGPQARCTASRE